MRPKYDMLWKGMIEEVMADLLLFVDPDIGTQVDLSRGFEYLDKELVEIFPEPEASNMKAVDKLVKVFLRDGGERWLLFHVEVQGKNSEKFPARMFEYYTRLRRRGRSVAAIAILTGRERGKGPGVYVDRCLWTSVRYEYKTLRILDYSDESLKMSNNPFAAVLLIAKEGLLQLGATDSESDRILFNQKLLVDKLLNEKKVIFGEESNKNQNNITMGIIEQMNEIKRQEGIQVGLENAVRKLLLNSKFSVEEIAKLVEVPVSLVKKVKKGLKNK